MLRCPACGTKLDIADAMELTARQQLIRDAIERINRDTGRLARTVTIAEAVGYAPTTIKPDLAHLEHMGIVCRPNGRKSGWALMKERVTLVLARAA